MPRLASKSPIVAPHKLGVTRAARGTRRLHGVIPACDTRWLEDFRYERQGNDDPSRRDRRQRCNGILPSYEHATTDDVIKALRRVEECDKPQTNGKSGYFDPPPVNKVINLAKGYLPTIVLHRLHGAPETFVDGAVAMKSDFVAIGQRWLDDLVQRMPDLEHVKHVADGLRALNLPKEVYSGSKAFLSASHKDAVFRIAAFWPPLISKSMATN